MKEEKQGTYKFQPVKSALWKPESPKINDKSNCVTFSINMHTITLPNQRERKKGFKSVRAEGKERGRKLEGGKNTQRWMKMEAQPSKI